MGDNGELILEFMVELLGDKSARTADRLEAAKWLADRGFGKAVQAVEIDVPVQSWASAVSDLPLEDLETMIAILEKYESGRAIVAASTRPQLDAGREPQRRGCPGPRP